MIKVYHTDNGFFSTYYFKEDLFNKQQRIKLSGDSASHQNGKVERSIKTLVNIKITMMIHAALRCPKDALSIYF